MVPDVAIEIYNKGVEIPFEDGAASFFAIKAIKDLLCIDEEKPLQMLEESKKNIIKLFTLIPNFHSVGEK